MQVTISYTNTGNSGHLLALEGKSADIGPLRLALVSTGNPGPVATVDLIFDQYTEFSLKHINAQTMKSLDSPAAPTCCVHLTGYHMPIGEGIVPPPSWC